jgi:hypothetical protein
MPTVWMALQEAPVPHWVSPARREAASMDGEQMRAHFLSVPEDDWRAHCGAAVTPVGTSVGHAAEAQSGEQKEPVTPWIWTATSSEPQPAEGF